MSTVPSRQSPDSRESTRGNPLRQPAFRWYFTGITVSLLGSAMAPVALAFSVLEHSDQTLDLGWVLAARSIPLVTFLLVGGAVADRFSRSAVLWIANLGAATTQAMVACILLTDNYNLGLIVALEFLNGTLTAFTQPAMRGIVPQLVAEEDLRRANSLLGSARNAIIVLGPTVAGVVFVTVGGGWAIAADSATYLVAAFCMSRLSLPATTMDRGRRVLTDIRDGWREFKSLTWVWAIVASLSVTNLLRTGIFSVLGPIIAVGTIGAASWGVVLSARAVGVLVMSVVMYKLVVRRLITFGQLCLGLGSLPLIALGTDTGLWTLIPAAVLAGMGSGVFAPAWETTLQENVPNAMLSRVSSYDDLFSYVSVPVGMIVAAPAGIAFGNERVALVGGFVFLLATLLPLLSPSVRRLRHG
ncbi:MFS transporter [Paractinoplanes rishiriensis]|uniref:MFS transporter n=1 Tax=Paractinoplanes rishiriensis TaxID=1050105 RepID=A0A919K9T0_9ACTN|nr:MFS transporter [Actinoplanes rishiriensis]GIF01353.1 MFS transporter [Actinoplanes rishiriensis]